MHRFVTFISRTEEIESYRRRYPDIEMSFVSYAPLEPHAVRIGQENYASAFSQLENEHRHRPFTGVLNRREKYVVPAALLALRLGLRPISNDPYLARDKYRMRRALSAGNDDVRIFLIRQAADLDAVPDDLFPGVLKPRFGFNSRAVTLVRNRDQLAASFNASRRHYGMLKREDTTNCDFVVEELITGSEHTVEALVHDGQIILNAISDKAAMRPPYFVEEGDTMPSCLPESQQCIVLNAACWAVERLEIRNGWAHIEVKLANDEATVVEAAARMGGGYFDQMIELAYGVDQMRLLIDLHIATCAPRTLIPRVAVVGKRIGSFGISYVIAVRWGGEKEQLPDGMRLIWPRSLKDVRGFFIGPPFAYKNTILEYFCADIDVAKALRRAEHIKRGIQIMRIPVPTIFGQATWHLIRLWLQLRGRQWLDG